MHLSSRLDSLDRSPSYKNKQMVAGRSQGAPAAVAPREVGWSGNGSGKGGELFVGTV